MHNARFSNDLRGGMLRGLHAAPLRIIVGLSLLKGTEVIVKHIVHGVSLFRSDTGRNEEVSAVLKGGVLRVYGTVCFHFQIN